MKIGPLLAHLDELEMAYAETLRQWAERYSEEDVYHQCLTFAVTADQAATRLAPLRQRYRGEAEWKTVSPGHGQMLLEELRSLYLLAHEVASTWIMALQAAKAVRDAELKQVADDRYTETETQARWFLTKIKTGAPQALVVE